MKKCISSNYIALGKIFQSQGDYDKAVSLYAKYLAINPGYTYLAIEYGICLLILRKYAEAIERFSKVLETNPQNYDAYNNWAVTLYEQMDYDAACAKWAKVIELKESHVEAYFNIGLALYQQDKDTEAVEIVKKGINFLDSESRKQYVKVIEEEIFTYKATLPVLNEEAHIKHSERNVEGLQKIINLLASIPKDNDSV